ncbi:Os01g0580300 [Oryza sativa Japonica Group]|uniref:Os01g0580300 protein n=4 Tax=Oryza TaxID=4527 RepID=B9EXQ0_ORYSJ|nr:hypothetical protein OsI_02570 [Oryza sativa Indica Group]EEE54863.1 hypothetical protein OsJ_02343 [Oryza sativa Japonica Group]KAB8081998.1 hypothetical protein EE612_003696 [Oryza sativa]BAF05320.1 Os01g0580300 [Oryza sativa Japonica Group]BAS72859.1 Os01g0580300 [Oryza sativa Japonica Group]|eukprot:NP_001043406.1 Os01g0580300 [Oryza sativa Japonica Group]
MFPGPSSSSAAAGPGFTEKNGLHVDPMAAAAWSGGRTNGKEDAEMVLADQEELATPSASAGVGGREGRRRREWIGGGGRGGASGGAAGASAGAGAGVDAEGR